MEQDLAEQITGVPPVPNIIFDSSLFEEEDEIGIIRESVKLSNIVFEFPYALANVDLRETCRALCDLENFDIMYDYTMQALTGKTLKIWMKNPGGDKYLLDEVYIVDKYQDLRGVDSFAEWPWLVNWLVEFMGAYLGKQFPMPGQKPVRKASGKNGNGRKGTLKQPKAG